jgi:hypothetical protein
MRISVINVCVKQATYFAGRWDSRRNFEWKISIGVWAILLATIRFLPEIHNFRWWMPIVPVVLHSIWLNGVWKANHYDRMRARYFSNQAEKLIVDSPHPFHWDPLPGDRPAPTWFGRLKLFLADWSMQFQLLTTILLAAALYWFSRPELTHLPVQ